MGLKIYWQDVWPEKIPSVARLGMMWEGLLNYGKKVLRPDTELVMEHPEISGMFLQFSYLELLNNRSVVEGVIHAADMGYDGAMIGCYADPGLDEARNITPALVAKELDGLPKNKYHCSNLGAQALNEAIDDYLRKQGKEVESRNWNDEEDEEHE